MADRVDLVLNCALCYLFSKINKFENRLIKVSMLEFYSAADICDAKEALMKAVSILPDKLTKIRDRRDGDGRVNRELDDISQYCQ